MELFGTQMLLAERLPWEAGIHTYWRANGHARCWHARDVADGHSLWQTVPGTVYGLWLGPAEDAGALPGGQAVRVVG